MSCFRRFAFGLVLGFLQCAGGASYAHSLSEWSAQTERTRTALHRMEALINADSGSDKESAYERYMATFADDVLVHGLVVSGDVDLSGVRAFYKGLFGTFQDSVLISDELIVAGPMAAQRYHALGRMDGQFDGRKLRNQRVAIRGQTFFRINEQGLIAERWSNHDHAFRMAQTGGEEARSTGASLANELNGPGLSEQQVYERLKELGEEFNRIESPTERYSRFMAMFDDSVLAHGYQAEVLGKPELEQYYQRFWQAFPDAVINLDATLSCWSMGAIRWRITASQREQWAEQAFIDEPVLINGETILTFSPNGLITEIWMNAADPQALASP